MQDGFRLVACGLTALKEAVAAGCLQQSEAAAVLHACCTCLQIVHNAFFCPRCTARVAKTPVRISRAAVLQHALLLSAATSTPALCALCRCGEASVPAEDMLCIFLALCRWLEAAGSQDFQEHAQHMRSHIKDTIGPLFAGMIPLCCPCSAAGEHLGACGLPSSQRPRPLHAAQCSCSTWGLHGIWISRPRGVGANQSFV